MFGFVAHFGAVIPFRIYTKKLPICGILKKEFQQVLSLLEL
jgi:hypothetical protein